MPLIQRPSKLVKITLFDGKERVLRYPFSVCKFINEKFGENITLVNFGEVLWHGLKENDPGLTVEQVEEICDPTMLPYIQQQFEMAMGRRPIEEPEKNEPSVDLQVTEKPLTGFTSGVSDASNLASQTAISGT